MKKFLGSVIGLVLGAVPFAAFAATPSVVPNVTDVYNNDTVQGVDGPGPLGWTSCALGALGNDASQHYYVVSFLSGLSGGSYDGDMADCTNVVWQSLEDVAVDDTVHMVVWDQSEQLNDIGYNDDTYSVVADPNAPWFVSDTTLHLHNGNRGE